jgi:hypothetical protein
VRLELSLIGRERDVLLAGGLLSHARASLVE